ncbi:hypothetical protein FRZ61_37150 [Hypericibacter adhaerens]|jgi:hypothetical protein|uniref:Uncharacterized protein n=1 Tax=Hypericibacter adhaerens TaxID=2602016 RepID=A0A5J6N8V4_9PROT|nr:hypothetical protein [Hypericibacter adhaerens]QEX23776.1 hypothetical protein FRZ61_37150 [Hypericibacter adhaerens]
MIPVGEFLPDGSAFEGAGAAEALNVIPAARSYRSLRSLVASGAPASTSRIQGGTTLRSTDLTVKSFCGDATKLHGFDGSTWSDYSRTSGGAYNTPTQGQWRFAQFGDACLAVNGSDAVQSIVMAAGTNFAAQSGSPPAGSRYVAVVRDVVVLGRDGSNSNRVSWSDVENLDWTAGAADIQDMPDGGQIMGLFGGDNLVVLQERCIRLGIRTDYPLTFTFDKIAQDKGCLAEWASAQHENLLFFLAHDGFHLLVSGQQLTPIGAEKVDRFFFEHPEHGVDLNNLHRVTGAVDPVNKLYMVSYPSVGGGTSHPDKALIYHWQLGRWSRAEFGCDLLLSAMVQSSWNLDNIDTLIGNLDATSLSLDDPAFTGSGRLFLAAFTSGHELGFFNGGSLAATVETGEAQLTPGRRSLVTGIRPLVDGGNAAASVALGSRNRPGEAVAYGPAMTMNGNGLVPLRHDARFHRARILLEAGADYSHILGIEPEFQASGRR